LRIARSRICVSFVPAISVALALRAASTMCAPGSEPEQKWDRPSASVTGPVSFSVPPPCQCPTNPMKRRRFEAALADLRRMSLRVAADLYIERVAA